MALRSPLRVGPPFVSLPCQRSAPLEASASFVDFCNRFRHAGTPSEPSFLAREWELSFPLLAGIDRCRLRWPDRCVAAAGAGEPRSAACLLSRGTARLRGMANHGPERSREGRPRALDECARALLVIAPSTRVTGSNCRRAWIARRVIAPAETHLGCLPAKGDTVGRAKVLSVRDGTPTQAIDFSIARARTTPPSRRLRRGIARESETPFGPLLGALR